MDTLNTPNETSFNFQSDYESSSSYYMPRKHWLYVTIPGIKSLVFRVSPYPDRTVEIYSLTTPCVVFEEHSKRLILRSGNPVKPVPLDYTFLHFNEIVGYWRPLTAETMPSPWGGESVDELKKIVLAAQEPDSK